MLGGKSQKQTTKTQTHKDYFLLSLIILSQLHVVFRGLNTRVDWFLFIDYTRRIDYAVMYLGQYLTEIILSYCLLFPKNISKDVRVLIFTMCCADLLHYFTTSSIGFGMEKLFIVGSVFLCYKYFNKYF